MTGTAAKDGKKVKKGQALSASVTVKKVEVPKQNLAAQYSTNKVGMGVKKTINFNAGKDASIADWDSSMLIAQAPPTTTRACTARIPCMRFRSICMRCMAPTMTTTSTSCGK